MSSPERDLPALLQQLSSLGVLFQPENASTALRRPVLSTNITPQSPSLSNSEASPLEEIFLELIDDFEDELQIVQAAASHEGELGPAPRPNLERSFVVTEGFISRKNFEETLRQEAAGIRFKKTYVGAEKHCSTKPISLLSRIPLRDMFVRKIHFGKYLLCRIIVPASRVVAIEAVVEDPEGDVQLLSLYNFPSMMNAGTDEIDAVFPVGTILAIREPYIQSSPINEHHPFIGVDSPSDIVFPDPTSEILQGVTWRFDTNVVKVPSTILGWKEAGSRHFKAARWLAAAIAYTKGLGLDPSDIVLRANRAETYLRLGYFSAALFDAEKVLQSLDVPENMQHKCLFHAGKAAYAQDNFEKALHYFRRYHACSPRGSNDADIWISRALSRSMEQRYGRYDWAQIFLESTKPNSAMDLADYVGPVEVNNIPSRGCRGVIATKDVKVGELLVVTKPFVAVFPEELSSRIFATDVITKEIVDSCSFTTRVVEKLYGNPELRDLVYHLCPGSSYPRPPTTYPPQITTSPPSDRNPLDSGIDIDVALLDSICEVNSFRPQPLHDDQSVFNSGPNEADHPFALYLLPSLINHSCIENATRIYFREVMVIRAKTNISKGEEITFMYAWGDTASSRQRQLNKYGFTCACLLCEDERADGELACRRREELIESMSDVYPSNQKAAPVTAKSFDKPTEALELIIKQVSETYTSTHRTAVRPPLVWLHRLLSQELRAQAHRHDVRPYYQAVSEEIKAIEAMGVSVIDKSTRGEIAGPHQSNRLPIKTDSGPQGGENCVIMVLVIVRSFLDLGDHLRAARWLRAAWWLEDIDVGGGRELFEEHYKSTLLKMGINPWGKGIE